MKLIAEIDGRREEYTIPEGTVTVGRDLDCDIPLVSSSISRRHLEIHFANGELSVRDLDSRNGTYVNERPVEEAFVAPGEVVRAGSVVLRFVRTGDSAVPPLTGEGAAAAGALSAAGESGRAASDDQPTPLNLPAVRGDQPTPSEPQALVVGARPLGKSMLSPLVRRILIGVLAVTVLGIGAIWYSRHKEAQAEREGVMSVAKYRSQIDKAVEMVRADQRAEAMELLERLAEFRTRPERFTASFFLAALKADARLDRNFPENWDSALTAWEDLANDTATTEPARELALEQSRQISLEAQNMVAHDRAVDLFEKGEYVEFLRKAAEIDPESAFAIAINQRVIDARSRIHRDLTEEADELARQQEWGAAVEKLQTVLRHVPEMRNRIEPRIAQFKEYEGHMNLLDSARRALEQGDARAVERAASRVPDDSPYAKARDTLLDRAAEAETRQRALDLYGGGKADAAIEALREKGLEESALAGRIGTVRELYETLERGIEQFQFERADTAASQIVDIEENRRNYYRMKAEAYLRDKDGFRRQRAEAVLDEAQEAYQRGDYAESRDKAEQARTLYPRLVEAARFIGVMKKDAERIYNVEALRLRDTDPEKALEAARQVRDLSRPGESFYARAVELIRRLEEQED